MRNEKAFIVVLAYIIGFTTAFIAYGVPTLETHQDKKSSSQKIAEQSGSIVTAYVNETGLFAETQAGSVIISAKATEQSIQKDGWHYDIATASVSPNGRFVHYCEQSLEIPTECKHFVYVAENHTVHRVTRNGTQLVSDTNTVSNPWTNDNRLQFGTSESNSSVNPWVLTAQ